MVGTVTVVNAADQSQALPGLSVMACFQGNLTCSPPASPAATTNANGTVQLTVPMSTQGGLDGFLGYIQITDPTGTYYPTNAFPGFPITQPLNSTVIDGTAQFAETIIQLTGTTYNPTRSSVVVTVEDCAGATGADASFSNRTERRGDQDHLPAEFHPRPLRHRDRLGRDGDHRERDPRAGDPHNARRRCHSRSRLDDVLHHLRNHVNRRGDADAVATVCQKRATQETLAPRAVGSTESAPAAVGWRVKKRIAAAPSPAAPATKEPVDQSAFVAAELLVEAAPIEQCAPVQPACAWFSSEIAWSPK